MMQDSTLNNLILPEGYKTCQLGDLGNVKKTGTLKQSMILISGIGFGNEIYSDFINHYAKDFTIYAITPAGFGETPAPPTPDTSVSYGELTWTNGILNGVLNLIEKEKLDKPVIIAHFVTATQVALNLALNHPDKIGKVIIISGAPYRYYAEMKDGAWNDWENEKKVTPELRVKLSDTYWAPKWFKTVTKKTWDDNMWTPGDYCTDNIIGDKLFKTSADVPLQVMVRYLIEWGAYDVSENYKDISVPLLILIPDFAGIFIPIEDAASSKKCEVPAAKQYLKYFHQVNWDPAINSGNPLIQSKIISNTRLFMWYDNPNDTYQAINDFINTN